MPTPQHSRWRPSLIAGILLLSQFTAGQAGGADPRTTPADPAAPNGRCVGFAHEIRVAPGVVGCTHGPDPAPPGIDVRVAPSDAELTARAAGAASALAEAQAGAPPPSVPCIGTGTSGKRLEAIYAYRDGNPNDYAIYAPMIRTWAAAADGIFDTSAATTGGSRHLRWRHDADCQPFVHEVAISVANNFDTMIDELYFTGFDRTDRRYVVWFDGTLSDANCGIAMNTFDDRPGPENILNGNPSAGLGLFAMIAKPCWGVEAPDTLVEAHEIAHTLGAVQPTAPNSSSVISGDDVDFYGHCIDEFDTMCYADGTPKKLVFRCSSVYERLLDCQSNDYFSTKPPAGSYLATHWNTASSSFLVTVDPVAGFLDLGSSPFKNDIAWLKASGITTGCSANQEQFCPTLSVSRGQMAAFLVRALDLLQTSTNFFTDDAGHLFENDINRLAAAGITTGCSATAFCPDVTITREQMAAFLDRALDPDPTGADFFTDDETSIFEASINRLAAAGITTGCGSGKFCPLTFVTREQMAAFLRRALN